jgi:hypothetical protein
MIRLADGGIRVVMVTSSSFPLVALVTLTFEPRGRLGCPALNPPACISWVAIPRWTKFPWLICAIQKLAVKKNPSVSAKTRCMSTFFSPYY